MVLYEARGYQIVDIKGIPTNTELRLEPGKDNDMCKIIIDFCPDVFFEHLYKLKNCRTESKKLIYQ
jgi:hypothetical protein